MSAVYNFLKAIVDPLIPVLAFIFIVLIYTLRNVKNWTVKLLLTLSFASLYIASLSPVSNYMCYLLEEEYLLKESKTARQYDVVVVVLGGGISSNMYIQETMPSYQTASRILYAVQVFKTTGASHLVCSGKGVGKITEAEIMGNIAEKLGVSRKNIRLDSRSANTREHALLLSQMFSDKNVGIGLVTSAYHMKRSEKEFRKYFTNVIPLPSDYLYVSPSLSFFSFIPKSGNLYKSSIALQEITGLCWYSLKG